MFRRQKRNDLGYDLDRETWEHENEKGKLFRKLHTKMTNEELVDYNRKHPKNPIDPTEVTIISSDDAQKATLDPKCGNNPECYAECNYVENKEQCFKDFTLRERERIEENEDEEDEKQLDLINFKNDVNVNTIFECIEKNSQMNQNNIDDEIRCYEQKIKIENLKENDSAKKSKLTWNRKIYDLERWEVKNKKFTAYLSGNHGEFEKFFREKPRKIYVPMDTLPDSWKNAEIQVLPFEAKGGGRNRMGSKIKSHKKRHVPRPTLRRAHKKRKNYTKKLLLK